MSVFLPSDVLDQFAANVELVGNASTSTGAFVRSPYRFTLDGEPDSTPPGMYFLDMVAIQPHLRRWGDGSQITDSTVSVRILYNRSGGTAGGGDRQTVLRNAATDCSKLGDVCENPANYGASTSGIRIVTFQGASRVEDSPSKEIWDARFACQWQSDMDTTTVQDLTQQNILVASLTALGAYATNSIADGSQAFVTDHSVWRAYRWRAGDTQTPDGVTIIGGTPSGAGNWLAEWYGSGLTLTSTVA